MTNFADFGLPETLMNAIDKLGFTEPTPIQAQAIPFALQDRDVLGSASTGTGKTAAYAIPMIAHLIKSPRSTALVMCPTRELAVQVLSTLQPLLINHREINSACLIGGEPMGKQFAQLDRRPRIIVGTPGRINDHLARRSLRLDYADFLVLDETDRMLDMGFGVQIEKIIPMMRAERQTLMFSATLPQQIVKMSARYLKNPERVSVGSTSKPAANIKQEVVMTTDGEKYNNLLEQLDKREGSVIVFVKTKFGADRLATRLDRADYSADAIHGDLQQRRRDKVIQAFRDQRYRILVATDVAARGLDIPHIQHVINFDLPQCPEDYIHRIGRTARAGAEGEAVNLVTNADRGKWNAIQRLINPDESRGSRDRANDDEGGREEGRSGGSGRSRPRNNGGGPNRKKPFKFKQHSRKPARREAA
jgi:ATP-dependent RNA helicase DeaD